MTRRTYFKLVTAAAAGELALAGKDNNAMKELLEASQNEKKGINLYVKGQTIGGVVTKVAGDVVEMRSREFSRIVVRIEAIDAAAMN
jgi:hypothetical protein